MTVEMSPSSETTIVSQARSLAGFLARGPTKTFTQPRQLKAAIAEILINPIAEGDSCRDDRARVHELTERLQVLDAMIRAQLRRDDASAAIRWLGTATSIASRTLAHLTEVMALTAPDDAQETVELMRNELSRLAIHSLVNLQRAIAQVDVQVQ